MGENGTPHLQGFCSFSTRKTLQSIRTIILPQGSSAHFEVARGTPAQASNYCKKDGAFTELGQLPKGRGTRSDLALLSERIREGASSKEIETEFPGQFIRYRANILASIREKIQPRTWETNVIVLWGRSGAGKTRTVFDYHAIEHIWVHGSGKWFDGYDGHEIALFDDYTGSEFKLGFLLKLLDRYPMRVEVKGGFVQWVPKMIYFTSNKDPETWYPNVSEQHRAALFRRFTQVQHFE